MNSQFQDFSAYATWTFDAAYSVRLMRLAREFEKFGFSGRSYDVSGRRSVMIISQSICANDLVVLGSAIIFLRGCIPFRNGFDVNWRTKKISAHVDVETANEGSECSSSDEHFSGHIIARVNKQDELCWVQIKPHNTARIVNLIETTSFTEDGEWNTLHGSHHNE